MKIRTLGLLVLLTLGCSAVVVGQSITIDQIVGSYTHESETFLMTGDTIVFHIRMNAGGNYHKGLTNGWRIYTTDGAEWDTTIITKTTALTRDDNFDLIYSVWKRSTEGTVTDTVGINAAVQENLWGMPADFDDVTHLITIGPIDEAYVDKHICIDSSFYPPSGAWMWADIASSPSWYSEPQCYRIISDESQAGVFSHDNDVLPDQWSLGQNYPNPFNPTTEVAFDVRTRSHVRLAVYNVLGQHVTNLVDETLSPGSYTTRWDGTSDGGSSVASGVYFYRLETDEYVATRKMMLLK